MADHDPDIAKFYEGEDDLDSVRAGYAKLDADGGRPKDFYFYIYERIGTDGMMLTGAVMRKKTRGKNAGHPAIVPGTTKVVVVTRADIEKLTNQGPV